jgi:hypothetical protein
MFGSCKRLHVPPNFKKEGTVLVKSLKIEGVSEKGFPGSPLAGSLHMNNSPSKHSLDSDFTKSVRNAGPNIGYRGRSVLSSSNSRDY